mgnify:CR=1 FL=1
MYPRNDLSYAENFLHMMFGTPCEEYKPNPVLANAMGHVDFYSTEIYIHVDATALQQASEKFRQHVHHYLEH